MEPLSSRVNRLRRAQQSRSLPGKTTSPFNCLPGTRQICYWPLIKLIMAMLSKGMSYFDNWPIPSEQTAINPSCASSGWRNG